ncbi:hypothetical protein OIU77_016177 [Salix suchowensis]|uniref:Uncharacterized protein n=1 Tax=Salix suchowensis TaxID=1278906 RepID=A0ABQ8ZJH2_9ROSI|nr:hypothetical protein OIU77_016177 [Salix suchowensis]
MPVNPHLRCLQVAEMGHCMAYQEGQFGNMTIIKIFEARSSNQKEMKGQRKFEEIGLMSAAANNGVSTDESTDQDSKYHHKQVDHHRKARRLLLEKDSKVDGRSQVIKGQWSPQEDRLLVHLVKQYGIKKWSLIAKMLEGRVGKQCRERWHNHLRPDIKVSPLFSSLFFSLFFLVPSL